MIATDLRFMASTLFKQCHEKPVFGVSHQVRHKLGCPATEDGSRLEIWNKEVAKTADLCLCFCICEKQVFS